MERTILDSVVRITSERDSESLERSLVMTVAEVINVSQVAFLKVVSDDQHYADIVLRLQVSTDSEVGKRLEWQPPIARVAVDEGVREAFASERAVEQVAEEGGYRTIFPFTSAIGSVGALVINVPIRLSGDERLVEGLLKIYLNYLALFDESQRDQLTGLYNRRVLDTKVNDLLVEQRQRQLAIWADPNSLERRTNDPEAFAWLAIMDIDHFKSVNDTFGHVVGDEVILLISQIMQKTFRGLDMMFRFGGEQILIVLEPVPQESAYGPLERFRAAVASFAFPQVESVTVSLGFAKISPTDLLVDGIDRADRALYYAKAHGRNRVCHYEALLDEGVIEPVRGAGSVELF